MKIEIKEAWFHDSGNFFVDADDRTVGMISGLNKRFEFNKYEEHDRLDLYAQYLVDKAVTEKIVALNVLWKLTS